MLVVAKTVMKCVTWPVIVGRRAGRIPCCYSSTKQVANCGVAKDLICYLYSDSEDKEAVHIVRVADQGSQPHCAKVPVEEVPKYAIATLRLISPLLVERSSKRWLQWSD